MAAPTAPARGMSVTYGGTTIGGASATELDGPITLDENYSSATVSFTAVVYGTTDANFATNCAALEDEFRDPRQRLRLYIGASTWRDYNPDSSVNTGFDAEPSCAQDMSRQSSARCRYYACSVTVFLPADNTGDSGLFWAQVEVSKKPNLARVCHIWGTYTALTTNGALAQYTASVDAYTGGVITALAGTWEQITRKYNKGYTDKTLTFNVVYDELIEDQGPNGADDAQIKQMVYRYRRTKVGIVDSSISVDKLVEAEIRYSCTLTKGVDPETKWIGTLRPWLLNYFTTILEAAQLILMQDEFNVERAQNTIEGVLLVKAVTGSGIVKYRYEQAVSRDFGAIVIPIWSGGPFDRAVFPGPQSMTRTRTHNYVAQEYASERFRGDVTGRTAGAPRGGAAFWASDIPWGDEEAKVYLTENWLLTGASSAVRPFTMGREGYETDFIEVTETVAEEYVLMKVGAPSDAGGGAGEEGEESSGRGSGGAQDWAWREGSRYEPGFEVGSNFGVIPTNTWADNLPPEM